MVSLLLDADQKWTIRRGHEGYPSMLEDLPSPPEVIYGAGNKEVLLTPCISIVGSRRATPYGLACADIAGRISAESDLTVVSGGALGCDAVAARAALAFGGKTIVVSGCGADLVYPRSSRDVFEGAIQKGGAVISLEPWGQGARRWAFPKRNRVIAALSRCTVITEAGHKSGTLSTADVAVSIDRQLLVVPGSIFSPESYGANQLIADGALVVASERDLEALIAINYSLLRREGDDRPIQPKGRIMSALLASPSRADDLANKLGEEVMSVLMALSDYEAHGLVEKLPDGRYSPTVEAFRTQDRISRKELALDNGAIRGNEQ